MFILLADPPGYSHRPEPPPGPRAWERDFSLVDTGEGVEGLFSCVTSPSPLCLPDLLPR